VPQVCVGPEFEVDPDGRLRLSLCGDPAETAWPYPCPTSENPLRKDPTCGLWIPPYAKAARATASGSTSSTQQTVPAGFTEVEQAEIDLVNPSSCYPAIAISWCQVDVDFYLPAGTDSRAGFTVSGNSVMALENPAPNTGTEMSGVHWDMLQPIAHGTVAAGGTNTLTIPIAVGSGQGGAQYGQIRWTIMSLILAGLQ
jgi:hypothetical protein